MTAPAWRPRVHPADDAIQQFRLARFRRNHPGVDIDPIEDSLDVCAWQARWDDESWETTIIRHRLKDLLDKLDEVLDTG